MKLKVVVTVACHSNVAPLWYTRVILLEEADQFANSNKHFVVRSLFFLSLPEYIGLLCNTALLEIALVSRAAGMTLHMYFQSTGLCRPAILSVKFLDPFLVNSLHLLLVRMCAKMTLVSGFMIVDDDYS